MTLPNILLIAAGIALVIAALGTLAFFAVRAGKIHDGLSPDQSRAPDREDH